MEDQNPVRSISVVSRLVSRCRSALLHCSVAHSSSNRCMRRLLTDEGPQDIISDTGPVWRSFLGEQLSGRITMRKLLAVLLGTLVFVGLIPPQSQATAQKLPQDGSIILGHSTSTIGPANLDPHTVVVPAPEVWTDWMGIIPFEAPGAPPSPPAPPPPPMAPFAFAPGTLAYIRGQL